MRDWITAGFAVLMIVVASALAVAAGIGLFLIAMLLFG